MYLNKKALLPKMIYVNIFSSKAVFSKESFLRSLGNLYSVSVAVNHQTYVWLIAAKTTLHPLYV